VSIGRRIRLARAWANLTQEEVANRAELQPSAISHFELDRRAPSASNLRRLAVALDISVDWLLELPTMPTRR
jgi:transcriptional regulator with XRE-family HTH domain